MGRQERGKYFLTASPYNKSVHYPIIDGQEPSFVEIKEIIEKEFSGYVSFDLITFWIEDGCIVFGTDL